MNSAVIPLEFWEWYGHGAHFYGSDQCSFRMTTRVGEYLISTVGDWYPQGIKGDRIPVHTLSKSFFETMVFPAGERMECGCTDTARLQPEETVHYLTAREAQQGHLATCRKWARLDE
jgi:hypothetical protein